MKDKEEILNTNIEFYRHWNAPALKEEIVSLNIAFQALEKMLWKMKAEKDLAYAKGKADGADKMFLEIAKLAEPDERQFGAGCLNTHLDEIHKIRADLKQTLSKGENNENNKTRKIRN